MRPELVAEVKFLTWTEDNLLRQVVYEGLREDKPAAEVRRDVPHPWRRGKIVSLSGPGALSKSRVMVGNRGAASALHTPENAVNLCIDVHSGRVNMIYNPKSYHCGVCRCCYSQDG